MRPDIQAKLGRARRGWLGVWVLMGLGVSPVARGGGADADTLEVERLRRQVEYLSDTLAAVRSESDALKAGLDRKRFDEAGGTGGESVVGRVEGRGREYKILEVNEELGMAVLNAGRRQGIRPGLQFAVMRGDKSIATLRVIDARPTIAGAVLLNRYGEDPKAQDRAVLVTGIRE